MVLGPLAETSLRDAAMSSNGNFMVLVQGPIPIFLYTVLLLILIWTVRGKIMASRKAKQEAGV